MLLVTAICIYISGWYVFHGSIVFHTDIARDFLLIEDIVKNKPLTLIGPRSGGIPGVFHGPLWLYLNVPAFVIGTGNPVTVGWFWMMLSIINLIVIFMTAQNLFRDQRISLFAVTLVAATTTADIRSLYNPWGALVLTPIFFHIYWRYLNTGKQIFLLSGIFILGLIIQFQMAFGVPLLILTFIHVLRHLLRSKKYSHVLSFLIILIPLSTFILFDLKHDFLQSKAIFNFITGKVNTGKVEMPFLNLLDDRTRKVFTDGLGFLTFNKWFLFIPLLFMFFKAGEELAKGKESKSRRLYLLLVYFYLGFWVLTLGFKGQIWGYYHWPFLGLLSMFFAALYKYVDRRLFYFIFISTLILNITSGIGKTVKNPDFISEDGGSWKFYNRMTNDIYVDADQDFGYYIFSGDQFAYTQRYAMNYRQKEFKNFRAFSFQKKKITYLILTPTDNPFLSVDGWKAGQVKLIKKPKKIFAYKNGIIVEKYELTPEEIEVPSDPNMIGATLIFR